MDLPTPNQEEVERFKALYLLRFGVDLSSENAFAKCTELMQYVYLTEQQ